MPLGSILLTLLALLGAQDVTDVVPATEPGASARWLQAVDATWRPLDDPNHEAQPVAVRKLSPILEAAFESTLGPRLLIARDLGVHESPIDAFVPDEEAMVKHGELIPVSDRPVEIAGQEALALDCEWSYEGGASRVAALYSRAESGTVRSLWLVTTEDVGFEELQAELTSTLQRFLKTTEPASTDVYSATLLGHEISFHLRAVEEAVTNGEGSVEHAIVLAPVAQPREDDAAFIALIAEANPQFDTAVVRQWADAERGVSLSYQVFATDLSLGPESQFVRWLAGVYQQAQRVDEERGDVPVELIHNPEAKTRVVADDVVEAHYKNNARAPDGGVILKVFLPRSPFAGICRLRWSDGEALDAGAGFVQFVELREYRRSRSEVITRVTVLMLLARAEDEADLELLEGQLGIITRPLEPDLRFPVEH